MYLWWSFRGTKSVITVSVVFVQTCFIERCKKRLVGLYLDLRGWSYQKQKLKVKVRCFCTEIATFWRLYCYRWARNLEKHQKWRHFEVTSLLGLELLRYCSNEGASCHYRRLAEGIVHWNILVSSFYVFCLVDIVKTVWKMRDFWPVFVIFGAIFSIFVILDVTQIVLHVCIAHVSCFQSCLSMV